MRVLVFNLATDADDPILGFTTAWINALAARVEHVSVITMRAGRVATAANVVVRSLGKERGWSEPRRAAAFYRHVGGVLLHDGIDVCFAHMNPLFATMFAPAGRLARVPTLLWYAHGATPRMLRIADRLVAGAVTPTSQGYRVPSDKLEVVGHGIEVERFVPPTDPASSRDRTVAMLGRISPVKRVLESVDALADANRAGAGLRMEIYGGPLVPADRAYEQRVRRRVAELGLEQVVTLHGPVTHADAPRALAGAGLYLSLSRSGSLDKTILEAMASGCLPVSSNDAFRTVAAGQGWTDLTADDGSAGECLAALAALPGSWRLARARELREYVLGSHSLDGLMDRIVERLAQLVSARAGRTSWRRTPRASADGRTPPRSGA